MTVLLAWLIALGPQQDGYRRPIPRPDAIATVIVTAATETEAPQIYAALLDVIFAHESGYRTEAVGDSGRSCGLGQTPCTRTPKDALGQARLVVRILHQANDVCPGHPIWAYASGRCRYSRIAAFYESEVKRELRP